MDQDTGDYKQTDPESTLERAFIAEYLERHGYTRDSLHDLPAAESAAVLRDASIYASAKLSEVEARAHYVHDIHDASKRSE